MPTTSSEFKGETKSRAEILGERLEEAVVPPRMAALDVALVLVTAAALMVAGASAPGVLWASVLGMLSLVLLALRTLRR